MEDLISISKVVVKLLLRLANAEEKIEIKMKGSMDLDIFKVVSEGSCWYGQLNSLNIIKYMIIDQSVGSEDYYSFLLTKDDLFLPTKNKVNRVGGLARADSAAIVNVGNSSINSDHMRIVVLIYHELGHMFGVPRSGRPEDSLDLSSGVHCNNVCVMRKDDKMINEIVGMDLFCPACLEELRDYFKK